MGKPSAPAAPDYAAAAQQQGQANVNSAIATNFLNQANQVGPTGSLTYSYDYANGYRDPQTGQIIPQTTATTTLSPEQQKLYDQQNSIGAALNDLAARGIGYVDQASATPIDQSKLPSMATGLAIPMGQSPTLSDFNSTRDKVTDAYMTRLQPYLDRERAAMDNRLANQGITHGSEAWNWDQDTFNRGANDQRVAALLAGDEASQNLLNNAMASRQQDFNIGLAGSEFNNSARQQAIQEADYFKNQPLNMLNALRSGNQVSMPSFGNATAGSTISSTPIYQATSDQYQAAMDAYKAKMAGYNSVLGGVASLGSAGITKFSDRRLKRDIEEIGKLSNGLKVYAYRYIWSTARAVGVMADEVAKIMPKALGPTISGFATVNYGAL